MKLFLALLLTISVGAFSKNLKWSSLYKGNTYTLNQQINVTDTKEDFSVPAQSKLKLIDSSALPMISVQLYKFSLPSCPSSSMKTELELLELPQGNAKVVVIGFDVIENCILEVFIEQKDIYSKSILK